MIKSIDIKGLRGILKGSLTDLCPLVLLVGPNGCGKSTVLDGLLIGANPNPAEAVAQTVTRRQGLGRTARWLVWKGDFDSHARIVVGTPMVSRAVNLTYEKNQGQIRGIIQLPYDSPNFLISFKDGNVQDIPTLYRALEGINDVRFLDPHQDRLRTPLHQLYSRIVEQGFHKETINTLATLLPGLEDTPILTEGESPVVHLRFADRSVPAALAGDGIHLLLHLSFELATRKGGLVLMEEPEVHLHPGAIRLCAKAILAAMRNDVQIVLSTHSLELIDCLLAESSADDLNKVSLYRLRLKDGELSSSRLSGSEVNFARNQIEDDLR